MGRKRWRVIIGVRNVKWSRGGEVEKEKREKVRKDKKGDPSRKIGTKTNQRRLFFVLLLRARFFFIFCVLNPPHTYINMYTACT